MAKNKDFTSIRDRHYSCVLYCTQARLESILLFNYHKIANYAFIKHDSDFYDDDIIENDVIIHKKGDLKKLHIHLVISFYNVQRWSTVVKMFTTEEDKPRVERCNSRSAQYRYLIHADNPEKYQYSKSLIISNDLSFFEKIDIHGDKKDSDNVAEKIIDDMLASVSPYLMVKRYGRDFIIHFNQYSCVVDAIREYSVSHPKKSRSAAETLPEFQDDDIPFD